MCPSCLSGDIGPGYVAAFAICVLFFLIAAGAMWWANNSGQLDGLEDTKFKMLQDE